jgi:hypothetical protein
VEKTKLFCPCWESNPAIQYFGWIVFVSIAGHMGGAEEQEGCIYEGMTGEYNEDVGWVNYLHLLPRH